MKLEYDPVGDILYIESVPPNAGQRTREVAEGVLVRCRPDTGAIESTEIQGLVARSRVGKLPIEVPEPGSANRVVVDYDAQTHSVLLRETDASSSSAQAVKLDSLAAEYTVEIAELAARRNKRATA